MLLQSAQGMAALRSCRGMIDALSDSPGGKRPSPKLEEPLANTLAQLSIVPARPRASIGSTVIPERGTFKPYECEREWKRRDRSARRGERPDCRSRRREQRHRKRWLDIRSEMEVASAITRVPKEGTRLR